MHFQMCFHCDHLAEALITDGACVWLLASVAHLMVDHGVLFGKTQTAVRTYVRFAATVHSGHMSSQAHWGNGKQNQSCLKKRVHPIIINNILTFRSKLVRTLLALHVQLFVVVLHVHGQLGARVRPLRALGALEVPYVAVPLLVRFERVLAHEALRAHVAGVRIRGGITVHVLVIVERLSRVERLAARLADQLAGRLRVNAFDVLAQLIALTVAFRAAGHLAREPASRMRVAGVTVLAQPMVAQRHIVAERRRTVVAAVRLKSDMLAQVRLDAVLCGEPSTAQVTLEFGSICALVGFRRCW